VKSLFKLKARLNLLVLYSLTCLHCLSGQLTINVTSVPPSTPSSDNIYIAGNFNNWNPGNNSNILTNNGDGSYTITFSPSAGLLEYKFTRGSWDTVEGNASGDFISNRTYNYTGGIQSVNDAIEGWEGLGDSHTAAPNVMILDQDFFMPQLNRTRRIWIYLPPDYDSTAKRYPVIYMHDGQNLFDKYYSFAGEWKIDESMNALFDDGDYGAIVVGIDNGGNQRINEYSPWVNPDYGGGDGERYAEFIIATLKPYIDSNFRTLPDREYTAIAGSSIGAYISLYSGIEYQEIFSKIGLFSPSFWFSDSIYQYVIEEGITEEMRIYFVAGDNESASMLTDMQNMFDTLSFAGLSENNMYLIHHPDGAHSEWYWAREYPDVYEWLFAEIMLGHHAPKVVKDFIYPNPADKYINVQSEENIPFIIYSSLGNVMLSSITNENRINISALPGGLYFVEIRPGRNESYISRFIKK
jgi:predicted alpha/beta superfamily hydrolase